MTVNLTNADAVLKSAYLDVVTKQLDFGVNPLLAEIQKSTNNIVGKDVKKVINTGMNGGVSAGTEDGILPTASGTPYKVLTLPLKNLYGTIEISDKAIRASQTNSGAFVNILNSEIESLLESATFHFGRMMFGTGDGTLAAVEEVNQALKWIKVDSTKMLVEGMRVKFLDPMNNGISGPNVITSIDRKTKIVYLNTFSNALDVGANMVMERYGEGMELTGLGAIFNKAMPIYGLERSESRFLTPYMQYNVGDITEAKIQKAIDDIEEDCGGKINFIVCSMGVKRALQEHLSTYRRNLDVLELKGGYKTLSYNGIPVVADRFCPEGTMYLLNTNDFCIHQLCDWQWLEGEDGRIIRQLADKPVYRATLVKYADLMCYRPCGQAMLSGITEA